MLGFHRKHHEVHFACLSGDRFIGNLSVLITNTSRFVSFSHICQVECFEYDSIVPSWTLKMILALVHVMVTTSLCIGTSFRGVCVSFP